MKAGFQTTHCDFLVESKLSLRKLDNTDSRDEDAIKLNLIKHVASHEFCPLLPGQGFLDLMSAYCDANFAVPHRT